MNFFNIFLKFDDNGGVGSYIQLTGNVEDILSRS